MRAATPPGACRRLPGGRRGSALPTAAQRRVDACRHRGTRTVARAAPAAGGGDGLAAQQLWLQRQRVLHHEPHPSDADIIELNVGGSHMTTTRSTLRQVEGSLLCMLFHPDNREHLAHDAAGRVFLDHDPGAFGLLLRHLREMRAAAGAAGVCLPAIPPADAASFRALNSHLGLKIPEEAIAAAVQRAAALAALGGGPSPATPVPPPYPYRAAGYERAAASPYASRPAPASACQTGAPPPPCLATPRSPAQRQQQQSQAQRQQLRVRAASPGPGSGAGASAAAGLGGRHGPGAAAAGMESLRSHLEAAAAAPAAAVPPRAPRGRQQQQQRWRHHQPGWPWNQPRAAVGPQPAADSPPAPATPGGAGAGPQQATQQAPYVQPQVQDFFILTSPPAPSATAAAGAGNGSFSGGSGATDALFRVSVLTEADMAAMQQLGAAGGGRGGGFAAGLPSSSDVFASASSSANLLTLSLVPRSSAALDNMFVGVTSSGHTDQRGLQIPCFGWHQLSGSVDDGPDASGCSSGGSAGLQQAERAASASDCAAGAGAAAAVQQRQPQLWQAGDLVQLVLQLGGAHRLSLRVNNQEILACTPPGGGAAAAAGDAASGGLDMTLPALPSWCFYMALFRGTQVVSVVLDARSVSVYSGDSVLKRYLY